MYKKRKRKNDPQPKNESFQVNTLPSKLLNFNVSFQSNCTIPEKEKGGMTFLTVQKNQ